MDVTDDPHAALTALVAACDAVARQEYATVEQKRAAFDAVIDHVLSVYPPSRDREKYLTQVRRTRAKVCRG